MEISVINKLVFICREHRAVRFLLGLGTGIVIVLLVVADLSDNSSLFFFKLLFAAMAGTGVLLLAHSLPSITRSRYYRLLKLPFLYWIMFLLFSTWTIYQLEIYNNYAFKGFAAGYRGRELSAFGAAAYVINLLTFSDSGEVIPVSSVAHVIVMLIKISQLCFLIWFIAFIVKARIEAQFSSGLTGGDFTKCQNFMQDILRKSAFVNAFFERLNADIYVSQENIAELERKREELQRLKSIEQQETDALLSSLTDVVHKELRRTATPNFLSSLTASIVVAVGGYLIGKIIESLF